MSKIAEVIKLKTGYANFVELKSAFDESQENAERMAMYRPTKAHRTAFERICKGLSHPRDKKFYLLSGSYGTGKSHLSLMTANILSRSSEDPELTGFYDNYAKLDSEKARILKNIRKNGQYLVAICDYHTGGNFEDVVMRAIFEASEGKGLETKILTQFDEADRLLADWKTNSDSGGIRNFYQDFVNTIDSISPGLTVEQLRAGLNDYQAEMLDNFRAVFKKIMGGIEFQAQAGNLISVIQNLLKSKAFKERFKGLAIFYDEFGFTLENGAYTKGILQGFMENICQYESNVMFIGCIHKDFKSYADRFNQNDAAVMSARLTQVDLLNEGIEEIIGAIVETDKDNDLWKTEIDPKTTIFDQLVPTCKTLNLFPWIENVKKIRERVLEDIYGVHPLALSCLLKLSSEIGSDARSTFTFFSGDIGGSNNSYADFIQNNELILSNGSLNLYTVDHLYDFFSKELSLKNPELRDRQRQFVNGYYASFEALRKSGEDELVGFEEDQNLKILRTILIFQLSQFSANLENLQFGLYCLNTAEKKQLKAELDSLVKKGVLFFRQQSKTYELAINAGEDPSDLIDRFVADTTLYPSDITKSFIEEVSGKQNTDFSVAKQYNIGFGEDKRFKTRYIPAKDLCTDFFDELNKDYKQNKNNPENSYEGTLVYALCENDLDLIQAKDSITNLKYDNISVAIPHSLQPFSDLLIKVKACRHYLSPTYPEKLSAQTESRLRDIFEDQVDGYLPQLKRIFRDIEDGSGSCWYKDGGKVLIDKPKQSHKPADMLCEELFNKRCRIKHPDLNYSHDDKWKTGKNSAVKQAVRILLGNDKVFIDNGNPDNHGEKRYLEKVLLMGGGALKKISSNGTVAYFSCETEPDKISDDYPALKLILSELLYLDSNKQFSLGTFLEKVKNGPYGCGGTTLILLLAFVIKAYGERLIVYKDSTCMIESPIRSYEDLVAVVSDPAPKLVFKVRKISDAQSRLVDQIAIVLDASPLMHGETRTLNSTFTILHEWWKKLPLVAKNISIYEKGLSERLNKLKVLLNDMDHSSDSFDFILSRLPEVYGIEIDQQLSTENIDSLIENFKQDIKTSNGGLTKAINLQSEELCKLFETKGDIVVCEHTIRQWHASLSSAQRETSKYTDEGAQQLLNRLSDTNINFSDAIMKYLPRDYGFEIIENWTSVHFKDYAARFNQAKIEIEKAKKAVYKPGIEHGSIEVDSNDEKYVTIPKGASGIAYTTDRSDPRTSENALKTSESIDLVKLLKNQPNIKINLRSFDNEGNYSEAVLVELINKEHKFDPRIDNDLFGNQELIIKCPEDLSSFKSVLKSIIRFGVKKQFVNKKDFQEVIKLVDNTLQENGD
ncbi:MAG: hypothetical protein HQ557_15395 [Bacteroidetes bacterium]|nr:hypothetical protein [Bacteroidota bacterium]